VDGVGGMFKLDKVESQRRGVTYGKSVSVLVRKLVLEPIQWSYAKLSRFSTIWGLDLGRRDMFVARNNFGEMLVQGVLHGRVVHIYQQQKNKNNHWLVYDDQAVFEARLLMTTRKMCSLTKLEQYTWFVLPRFNRLLAFSI